MTLFWQHFRAQRAGLLIWVISNALMAFAVTSAAPTIVESDVLNSLMEKWPPVLRTMAGFVPGMSAVDGFIQAKMGIWMAVILPIYACLLALSIVTREVDRRTADFLLALPVERSRVVLARWAVMVTNLAILALGIWAALVLGLQAVNVDGSFGGYFWMLAQAWLLSVALGSLALLASVWVDDYSFGVKVSMAAVGVLYVADLGLRVAELPKAVRFFNPYTYFDTAQPILQNHLIWGDAAVLAAVSLLGVALAARAFGAKQIHA